MLPTRLSDRQEFRRQQSQCAPEWNNCGLFKPLPDPKHPLSPQVPQPLFPRRRLCREDAGPSEGTSLWCRDGLGLEGICPEQTEGIAHPVCHLLLYLWSKNLLHLHLQSNRPNHYSSTALLKGKREKLQISFITLEGAPHLVSLHQGFRLHLAQPLFHLTGLRICPPLAWPHPHAIQWVWKLPVPGLGLL